MLSSNALALKNSVCLHVCVRVFVCVEIKGRDGPMRRGRPEKGKEEEKRKDKEKRRVKGGIEGGRKRGRKRSHHQFVTAARYQSRH